MCQRFKRDRLYFFNSLLRLRLVGNEARSSLYSS